MENKELEIPECPEGICDGSGYTEEEWGDKRCVCSIE